MLILIIRYDTIVRISQVYDNKMKTVLNWSSGKDAALAYHLLLQDDRYEVTHLLTTINDEQDRVVMHGVREQLLDAQAEHMNIPIKKIKLPASPTDDVYKTAMSDALEQLKSDGLQASAFGDIFLEDLKEYRESQLKNAGFEPVFPLWKKDTRELVSMLDQTGIEAKVVCVNENFLGKEFLGRKVDASFLNDLPDNVDPCGEYGEFHTFVYNAPYFSVPIAVQTGEAVRKVYSNEAGNWNPGFWFIDLYLK